MVEKPRKSSLLLSLTRTARICKPLQIVPQNTEETWYFGANLVPVVPEDEQSPGSTRAVRRPIGGRSMPDSRSRVHSQPWLRGRGFFARRGVDDRLRGVADRPAYRQEPDCDQEGQPAHPG